MVYVILALREHRNQKRHLCAYNIFYFENYVTFILKHIICKNDVFFLIKEYLLFVYSDTGIYGFHYIKEL